LEKFVLIWGMGEWGSGEMGEWGNGKFQLKPQHPKTPKPKNQQPFYRENYDH
jgi:DNA gyrase subunit A